MMTYKNPPDDLYDTNLTLVLDSTDILVPTLSCADKYICVLKSLKNNSIYHGMR